MPKMSPANEKEFEELSVFMKVYLVHFGHVAPDQCLPLAPIRGQVTKSQLLAGLREGTNDAVADAESLTPEDIAALDEACSAKGISTFSELRQRYSAKWRSLLKKRRISNDTEYYVAIDLVNNFSSPLSQEERSLLEGLVLAYEEKPSKHTQS